MGRPWASSTPAPTGVEAQGRSPLGNQWSPPLAGADSLALGRMPEDLSSGRFGQLQNSEQVRTRRPTVLPLHSVLLETRHQTDLLNPLALLGFFKPKLVMHTSCSAINREDPAGQGQGLLSHSNLSDQPTVLSVGGEADCHSHNLNTKTITECRRSKASGMLVVGGSSQVPRKQPAGTRLRAGPRLERIPWGCDCSSP